MASFSASMKLGSIKTGKLLKKTSILLIYYLFLSEDEVKLSFLEKNEPFKTLFEGKMSFLWWCQNKVMFFSYLGQLLLIKI